MKPRKYALFFFETLIHRLISDQELATCEQSDLIGHIKTERLNFQIAIKNMVISTTRTRELRHFLNQHYLDLNHLQELLQAKQQRIISGLCAVQNYSTSWSVYWPKWNTICRNDTDLCLNSTNFRLLRTWKCYSRSFLQNFRSLKTPFRLEVLACS